MKKEKETVEIRDRYSATGTPRPDRATACDPCEGMGCYPTKDRAKWPPGAKPDELGYVFVICEECDGTRLNAHGRALYPDAPRVKRANDDGDSDDDRMRFEEERRREADVRRKLDTGLAKGFVGWLRRLFG